MGYFDLPTGNFELLLKKRGRGRYKAEWESVMFTDRLYNEEIAYCVEEWSVNYNVEGARYNGKAVTIPTSYHWEHIIKGETIGCYSRKKDVLNALAERRHYNFRCSKKDRVPVGSIRFVQD